MPSSIRKIDRADEAVELEGVLVRRGPEASKDVDEPRRGLGSAGVPVWWLPKLA